MLQTTQEQTSRAGYYTPIFIKGQIILNNSNSICKYFHPEKLSIKTCIGAGLCLFVWYAVLWSQINRRSTYFIAGGFQDPEASLTEKY